MRALAAALVAALVSSVAAACGGDAGPGGAADIVPRDVALYAVVDTDFEGDQWSAVEELAAKFPGGENLRQRIVDEIEADDGSDLDFEEDVRPALGPEVALVVLEFAMDSGEEPPLVVMTQPQDEEALRRLLEDGDEPAASREVDGWQVIAGDEATLDRFDAARDGPSLADSDAFADAMDGLEEEDALVSLFVDGETVAGASGAEPGTAFLDAFYPGGAAPAVGATLAAEDDGARADVRLVYAEDVEDAPLSTEPYEAELPGRVPGDVLAYVSFNDLEGAFSAVRDALSESDPELERQLGLAEAFLGLSLEEDVAPLFAGEGALYVRPGALVPEVTLATQVDDEEQALATLDRMVETIGGFEPRLSDPQRVDADGVEARELAIAPPVTLTYAAFDGLLVLTTSREAIADLREEDDRLDDDEGFGDALDRAGMPGETSGFAYVDLEDALPLLFGYAEAGLGTTSEARDYAEPLRSLVAWGSQDGRVQSFTLDVGIE